MIVIQEIHQVIGVQELPFEDSYRDTYLPRVAEDPGTRLLWFAWSPHGAGQGYEAVTLTAAADLEAWDRHVERTRYGDLASWSMHVEAMRYTRHVQVCSLEPWLKTDFETLTDVPVVAGDREPTVLRLDTIFAHDCGSALSSLQQAHASADASVLTPAGCWSSVFGGFDGEPISVLYRVKSREALHDLLDAQDPLLQWPGSLAAAAGLDDEPMRTRMLRTARWSPLP